MTKYLDTIHLKADSEEAMLTALTGVLETDDKGVLVKATTTYFIDVFGELYKPTGNVLVDEEGDEYLEKVLLDGYHANLRTKNQDHVGALSNLTIEVDNPLRKIVGE